VQSERLYRDLLVVFTLTVVAKAGLARIGIEGLVIVFDQGDRTGSVGLGLDSKSLYSAVEVPPTSSFMIPTTSFRFLIIAFFSSLSRLDWNQAHPPLTSPACHSRRQEVVPRLKEL
jgi:hypothetical protein